MTCKVEFPCLNTHSQSHFRFLADPRYRRCRRGSPASPVLHLRGWQQLLSASGV